MAASYVLWQVRSRDELIIYPQVALPLKPGDTNAMEGVMLNASEPKVESKYDEKE